MKAPLSWLQDFVDINVDLETLTRTMIMHGLGIEGIERVYGAYDSIVVGKLLKIMPHENSDHLQICTVTTGDETLQIVTGAACRLPDCFAAAENWSSRTRIGKRRA